VTSIESNHKQIESARKGQEICVKIDPIPGESPKMFGRHFEADDMLISKVSQSTDSEDLSHLRFPNWANKRRDDKFISIRERKNQLGTRDRLECIIVGKLGTAISSLRVACGRCLWWDI